jgi:hypothetical protein
VSTIKIITTSTSTHHLLDGEQSDFRASYVAACGRRLAGWIGTHEAGPLASHLCKNCQRTRAFTAAEQVLWERDNRSRIIDAMAYVTSRFYPPLPAEYGALAVRAVDAVNDGDPYVEIVLPAGLNPLPHDAHVLEGKYVIFAVRLVQALRLDHMIDDEAV